MKLDSSTIKHQEYVGKLNFLSYLEDETLTYASEEKELISDSIIRCNRVLDKSDKSDFDRVMKYEFGLLLEALKNKSPDDEECTIYCFSKEPYYNYYLFVGEKSERVYGCIRSLDIQKVPSDIWHKIHFPDYTDELT